MTIKGMNQVEALGNDAVIEWFPCGDGQMPVRHWSNASAGKSAEKIVLVHGGSGSWMHWIANIRALRAAFDVYAIDLPGLGDAGMLSEGSDAVSAARVTGDALDQLVPGQCHLVAFSWGCTVSAMMLRRLAPRLGSVLLAGPAAVGSSRGRGQMQPLIKRTPDMTREEVLAAQRENLARLMLHDRSRIDDFAVALQDINTSKARFSSPQYAPTTLVLDGIRASQTPLCIVYGDHDVTVYPDMEERRSLLLSARPDARFEVIEDAGHWVQYEQPDAFNRLCTDWIDANRTG